MLRGTSIILREVSPLITNTHPHLALRTGCPGNTGLQASLGSGAIPQEDKSNGSSLHVLAMVDHDILDM